jgi:hypothetical protein
MRFTAVWSLIVEARTAQSWPVFSVIARVISVSINPGAIAFTVMPNCPSSIASVFAKPNKAAFEAA